MARKPKQSKQKSTRTKPAEKIASRFKPLRNKPREYLDLATGRRISRRQRDQAVLTGGKSLERRAKERRAAGLKPHTERYYKLVGERYEYLRSQGAKLTKGEIRKSPEMRELIRDLRTRNTAATGRKARALVQLGLRDETWTFAVGETPK
jgi:hypothetical protein